MLAVYGKRTLKPRTEAVLLDTESQSEGGIDLRHTLRSSLPAAIQRLRPVGKMHTKKNTTISPLASPRKARNA